MGVRPQKEAERGEAQGRARGDARAEGLDRFFEEINILQLEGRLFNFDRRRARQWPSTLTFEAFRTEPVTISIHPDFGRPHELAYKVLQSIFVKLTEEGHPYPNRVSFSQRELGRLIGYSDFGGVQSESLYRAVMQLHRTGISCSLYDKETREWVAASFYLLPEVLFSGRGRRIKACVVEMHPRIVASLNRNHTACFNLDRLNMLDPRGMVLYKRIFYHFSCLYEPAKAHRDLKLEKDYARVCDEWLGGMKPERYHARIEKQLGKTLALLRQSGLVRSCRIERRAKGEGFKLVARPGKGFFEDYRRFYLTRQQPQLRFSQTAAHRNIEQPLELVAHFHRLLGREGNRFDEKETAYASELLERFSEPDVRDLIEYAVAQARETGFPMCWFGALKVHLAQWERDRSRQQARAGRAATIAACSFCDENGKVFLKKGTDAPTALECPHSAVAIREIEERTGKERV